MSLVQTFDTLKPLAGYLACLVPRRCVHSRESSLDATAKAQ